MDSQDAAILKSTLVGVDLPARPRGLAAYAVAQGARPALLHLLSGIPDRPYESLDGVVEALLHVQPPRVEPGARRPHEESGAPPGGDAYVTSLSR
ncbi:MAG: DUF2795 domain-containing protein [Actinobacteria bacterium]|nr:DUF2795 domain-containing protein [Actinomycetota bacterium]